MHVSCSRSSIVTAKLELAAAESAPSCTATLNEDKKLSSALGRERLHAPEVSYIRATGHLPGHPIEEGEFVDIREGLPFALVIDKARRERLPPYGG